MSNIYENYQILKRNAYRSYWEKRILAEVGYLLELHCEEDISAKKLMEEAISVIGFILHC